MSEKAGKRPAFPRSGHQETTLRDYFAALAMQAMLTSTSSHVPEEIDAISKLAYQQADSMLSVR